MTISTALVQAMTHKDSDKSEDISDDEAQQTVVQM